LFCFSIIIFNAHPNWYIVICCHLCVCVMCACVCVYVCMCVYVCICVFVCVLCVIPFINLVCMCSYFVRFFFNFLISYIWWPVCMYVCICTLCVLLYVCVYVCCVVCYVFNITSLTEHKMSKHSNMTGAPVWVWNALADLAYHDGMDYFYQLNDDIRFEKDSAPGMCVVCAYVCVCLYVYVCICVCVCVLVVPCCSVF